MVEGGQRPFTFQVAQNTLDETEQQTSLHTFTGKQLHSLSLYLSPSPLPSSYPLPLPPPSTSLPPTHYLSPTSSYLSTSNSQNSFSLCLSSACTILSRADSVGTGTPGRYRLTQEDALFLLNIGLVMFTLETNGLGPERERNSSRLWN